MSKRFRHHVNPLVFTKSMEKLTLSGPFYVDIGCGRGDFVMSMAEHFPERNFVGIELRPNVTKDVSERAEKKGLKNLIILQGNASNNMTNVFAPCSIAEAYIFFPDPWFKPKHRKRTLFSERFMKELREVLADDGKVFLQTDQKEVFDEAVEKFLKHNFKESTTPFIEARSHWRKLKEDQRIFKAVFEKPAL